MKTADKKILRVTRDQIDTISKSRKSLMPDGILADLTAAEAADLIAFIESLASAPSEE